MKNLKGFDILVDRYYDYMILTVKKDQDKRVVTLPASLDETEFNFKVMELAALIESKEKESKK